MQKIIPVLRVQKVGVLAKTTEEVERRLGEAEACVGAWGAAPSDPALLEAHLSQLKVKQTNMK